MRGKKRNNNEPKNSYFLPIPPYFLIQENNPSQRTGVKKKTETQISFEKKERKK
jgi:hypothetical protein